MVVALDVRAARSRQIWHPAWVAHIAAKTSLPATSLMQVVRHHGSLVNAAVAPELCLSSQVWRVVILRLIHGIHHVPSIVVPHLWPAKGNMGLHGRWERGSCWCVLHRRDHLADGRILHRADDGICIDFLGFGGNQAKNR